MIAICPNPFRDTGLKYTLTVKTLLEKNGFDTAICPVFAEGVPEAVPEDIRTTALEDVLFDCTLAVVVGGDGTILAAVRKMLKTNIPVLGVNLGSKGFMAALEPESLELAVNAARGEMTISKRMMLDVELVRADEVIYRDCALNDAVMHGYGDCIKLTAWCDCDKVTEFSGDGIILSTPTGSTGYSMSAGGPIVEPDAENIILSPICAHMMCARTFVFGAKRTVTVKAEKLHDRKAYLSIDGNSVFDLKNGDILKIKKSENYINMADMGLKSFYETAYKKLT